MAIRHQLPTAINVIFCKHTKLQTGGRREEILFVIMFIDRWNSQNALF
jgi:hypothetical protein